MEMSRFRRRDAATAVALIAPLILCACEAVVAGGAATTGAVAVTQERSLGDAVDDARIEALEARYGLERPMHVQYLKWIWGVLRGDLGRSMAHNMEVNKLLAQRLPASLAISTLSLILVYLLGLPIGIYLATKGLGFRVSPALVRPLLTFGVALVPVMLGSWVIDASDRYLLRVYRSLDEVALYGIGYRFGQILEVGIVWPFQLAWPAFSFAIASKIGHERQYAHALTYLVLVMATAPAISKP